MMKKQLSLLMFLIAGVLVHESNLLGADRPFRGYPIISTGEEAINELGWPDRRRQAVAFINDHPSMFDNEKEMPNDLIARGFNNIFIFIQLSDQQFDSAKDDKARQETYDRFREMLALLDIFLASDRVKKNINNLRIYRTAENEGRSILDVAIERNLGSEVVDRLIKAGVDINAINRDVLTPLTLAIANACKASVRGGNSRLQLRTQGVVDLLVRSNANLTDQDIKEVLSEYEDENIIPCIKARIREVLTAQKRACPKDVEI